ncbi:helix-turn-helix transcriptional regulator [Slackia exigua]|uniref:helix-turn-helix transcriptional regulator n=1 Tax=Slackia exigua TaxID=84109 RepID=UPI00210DAB7C|nr:helix-turn-helix transcriptional regulator [Slackia exigua]MCQ5092055.1 helix-turn-helix transcriptional regulator [Slackia exigua]
MEEHPGNPDAYAMRLLAFIAFFVTIPLYSPNVVPFNGIVIADGIVKAFVEPLMAGAIFASAALFLATLKAGGFGGRALRGKTASSGALLFGIRPSSARFSSVSASDAPSSSASLADALPSSVSPLEALPSSALSSDTRSSSISSSGILFSGALPWIACALYATSMLTFYLSCAGVFPFVPMVVGVSGTLAGICLVPLFTMWAKTFSGNGPRRLLLTLCLTVGTTAVANWLFTYLPATPLVAVCSLLVIAGSFWPLLDSLIGRKRAERSIATEASISAATPIHTTIPDAESVVAIGATSPDKKGVVNTTFPDTSRIEEAVHLTDREGEAQARANASDASRFEPGTRPAKANSFANVSEEAPSDPKGMMRRFASVLMPAIVGLAMFAYFMGVSHAMLFDAISAESVGGALGALVVAVFCLRPSDGPLLHTLYQVLLPIASLITVVFITLPEHWAFMPEAFSAVTYTFFCIAALLALGLGLAGSNAGEFPTSLVVSGLTLAFALASAAGLASGSASSPSETWFIPTSIIAVYAAYLILPPIIGNARLIDSSREGRELGSLEDGFENVAVAADRNGMSAAAEHAAPAMDDTFFKQKAEEIGDAFRLSPREREILGYIGRGHSSVYIAKTLVISENTVYTHVRNIYRKTGADSREELLEMFIPSR